MKIVKFYRSLPATRGYQLKTFSSDFAISDGERAIVGMISTEDIDRDGEIMRAAGADFSSYENNPCVLVNHDYNALPVAKCVSLQKIAGKGIRAKAVFATKPDGYTGDWQPDICFSLIKQGVLAGFSVGFRPIAGHTPTDADRVKYGTRLNYIYDRWELLEFSLATIPANPNSVVEEVSKSAKRVVYLRKHDDDPDDEPPRPARSMVLHRRAA